MSALNSYSVASDLFASIPGLIVEETSERILSGKGIYIIPYDITRLVASVKVEIDVISTVNETRTLWSNPEVSFYGYCHIRSYKQSIGNPVQINQRNQVLFTWFPQDNVHTATQVNATLTLLQLLEAIVTEPNKIYLSSPLITDLSFGFQRDGKFRVRVTIGYFTEDAFPNNSLYEPVQFVPNPIDLETIDPSQYKDLGDPNIPVSPPYDQGSDDFGESNPGNPPTDPLPEGVPFSVVFIAEAPGYPRQERTTFSVNPGVVTSISYTPVRTATNWVLQGVGSNGNFTVALENIFPTEAQNQAFQDSFEFVRFVYQ